MAPNKNQRRKSIKALLITLAVGVVVQAHSGEFLNYPDVANQIAVLLGGAFGFLVWVVALPLLVAMFDVVRKRQFPHEDFSVQTYLLLVIVTVVVLIGNSFIMGAQ